MENKTKAWFQMEIKTMKTKLTNRLIGKERRERKYRYAELNRRN